MLPLEVDVITGCDKRLFLSGEYVSVLRLNMGTVMINEYILVIVRNACQTAKGWTVLDSNNNYCIPLLLGTHPLPWLQ